MKTNGWEQFLCPYFADICGKVLGEYFKVRGFTRRNNTIGGIWFERAGLFVEISYESETMPAYVPKVTIGMGKSLYDNDGPMAVPLWYIISAKGECHQYSSWHFSNDKQLLGVLSRILTSLIVPFVEPLLEDTKTLKGKIEEFRAEQKRR